MKKVILLLVVLMVGCTQPQLTGIRYIKDERTGICFAEAGWVDSYSFTAVPCEKVEKFIKK